MKHLATATPDVDTAAEPTTPRPATSTRHLAGGLLAVLVADAWRTGAPPATGGRTPIAAAMLALARTLTRPTTPDGLDGIAHRPGALAGPAWLLPLGLAHPEPTQQAEHTLDLVGTATTSDERDASTTYVELASRIAAQQTVPTAIADLTDHEIPAEQPLETGHHAADALAVALWALARATPFAEVFPPLAATSSRPVVAAASGLVGLRDGLIAIPRAWYRHLGLTDQCLTAAHALAHTRPHQ
jgi:hypothetical protein